MEKPVKAIVNVKTGEHVIVELSDAEIAQMELDVAANEKRIAEEQAIEAQKAADAQAGRDALVALGLTEAQINALLGA